MTSTAHPTVAVDATTTYVTDPVACRITQQVVEPNIPALKVITSFGFDGCGNLDSVHTGDRTRTARRCRRGRRAPTMAAAANCLSPPPTLRGSTTTYEWRYDFGVPTRDRSERARDDVEHDPFGRRTPKRRRRHAPDLDVPVVRHDRCWGTGDVRFLVYDRNYASDGAQVIARDASTTATNARAAGVPRCARNLAAVSTTTTQRAHGARIATVRERTQRPHDAFL